MAVIYNNEENSVSTLRGEAEVTRVEGKNTAPAIKARKEVVKHENPGEECIEDMSQLSEGLKWRETNYRLKGKCDRNIQYRLINCA